MRYLLLSFILIVLSSLTVSGQLLNGGFEEWEIRNGYLEPRYWITNNPGAEDTTRLPVTRVEGEDVIEGKYSMRIINEPNYEFGGPFGSAYIDIYVPEGYNVISVKIRVDTITPQMGYAQLVITSIEDGRREFLSFLRRALPTNGQVRDYELDFPDYIDSLHVELTSRVFLNPETNRFDSRVEFIVDEVKLEKQMTTSNTNLTHEGDFKIYPNPANDKLYIELANRDEIKSVELYDLSGKCVMREMGAHMVSLTSLPRGIYQLRCYLENGEVHQEKLIITNYK